MDGLGKWKIENFHVENWFPKDKSNRKNFIQQTQQQWRQKDNLIIYKEQ